MDTDADGGRVLPAESIIGGGGGGMDDILDFDVLFRDSSAVLCLCPPLDPVCVVAVDPSLTASADMSIGSSSSATKLSMGVGPVPNAVMAPSREPDRSEEEDAIASAPSPNRSNMASSPYTLVRLIFRAFGGAAVSAWNAGEGRMAVASDDANGDAPAASDIDMLRMLCERRAVGAAAAAAWAGESVCDAE